MKNILKNKKNIGIAFLWMVLFIVVQTIISFMLLNTKIQHDVNYAEEIGEILIPICEENNNVIDQAIEIMSVSGDLFKDILSNTLILSGVFLIGFFVWRTTRNKAQTLLNYNKHIESKIPTYIFAGLILNLISSILTNFYPASLQEMHQNSMNLALNGTPLNMLAITGIIVPITEEIIFRYGMLRPLINNKTLAIIYSSVMFGMLHGNPIQIIYAAVMGAYFAKVDIKENSILPSIIMHITINSSSVLSYFMFNNEIEGLLTMIIPFILIKITNYYSTIKEDIITL